MAVTLETSAGAALARGWAGLLRALGVAALVLLLAAGLFGPIGDWDANLLPVAVWVLWWVGMAFACALVGGLWRVLDPWQAIARGVGVLGGRRWCCSSPLPGPSWSGAATLTRARWPRWCSPGRRWPGRAWR
jgi:hypothetical protein